MDQTNQTDESNASAEPAAPSPAVVTAFWERAQQAVPELQSAGGCQWRWIGLDAPTTRQIFELIRAGDKTGTFTLPWLVERGERPPPQVGDCLVLVDYDGTPTLLVRTRRVHTVPFGDMTNEDTAVDGSPVRDIAVWRPLHTAYWGAMLEPYGLAVADDMPVIVEAFELLFDASHAE
jgi:uncharacterized protein YhfF